jgi:hypothetical protein
MRTEFHFLALFGRLMPAALSAASNSFCGSPEVRKPLHSRR